MATPPQNSRKRKCEMCEDVESKYRCPGCGLQTCSLPCVKLHKKKKNCDGKRCPTEFIDINEFDDNKLLSDYRFLENVSVCASNATRDHRNKEKTLNKHRLVMVNRARSKGINLCLMSPGMSKRRENSSLFSYKEKCLYWRVKLIFVDEAAEYVLRTVKETESIHNILKKYLDPEEADPVVRYRLRSYVRAGMDNIRIYLKKERSREPGYHEIGSSQTLQECLRNKTIYEYPIFNVTVVGKDNEFRKNNSKDKQNNGKSLNDYALARDLELPSTKLPNGKQDQIEQETSDGRIDAENRETCGNNFENDEEFDINKAKIEEDTDLPTGSSESTPSNHCTQEEVEPESIGGDSDAQRQNEQASSGLQYLVDHVEFDVTKVKTEIEDSPDKKDYTCAPNLRESKPYQVAQDCTEREEKSQRRGNEIGRKQLVIPEVKEEDEDSW